MKRLWLFLLLGVSLSLNAHIYMSNCADRVGVGNISLLSKSPITAYYNPAVSNVGTSTSISQPYGFSQVENGNFSVTKELNKISISLGCNYLVSSNFNQFSNNLAVNYKFNKFLKIGLGHKVINIIENDKYAANSSDIALLLKKDNSKVAITYSNLFNNHSSKILLPSILVTELSYEPSATTSIGLAFEKEKGYKLTTKVGIRYRPLPSLSILSGYSIEPNQMFAGIDVTYKKASIVYAIASHLELGLTHYLTLIYAY